MFERERKEERGCREGSTEGWRERGERERERPLWYDQEKMCPKQAILIQVLMTQMIHRLSCRFQNLAGHQNSMESLFKITMESEYLWVVTRHAYFFFLKFHRWFRWNPVAFFFFLKLWWWLCKTVGSTFSLAKVLPSWPLGHHFLHARFHQEQAIRQVPQLTTQSTGGMFLRTPWTKIPKQLIILFGSKGDVVQANPPSTICRESKLCHSQWLCQIPLATSSQNAGAGRGEGGAVPGRLGRSAFTPNTAAYLLKGQDKSLWPNLLIYKIVTENSDPRVLWATNGKKERKAPRKEPATEKELDQWYFPYHIF